MGLILFLVSPLLLASLVPRAWAGALLATLGLVWVAVGMEFTRIHANAADLMGMAMLSLAMMPMLVILGLRYLFAWRKQPPPDTASLGYRSAQAYVSGLAALVVAGVSTVVVVRLCNAWLPAAWWTHLVVAVGAGLWWWLLPRLRPAAPFKPAARWVGLGTMVLAMVWSLQSAQRVVHAAQAAAAGQAYCLQAATRDGLLPATSLWDITGFAMQAGRGNAMRHAQLAVGSVQAPVWRYWSYGKTAFEAENYGGVLTCVPQADAAVKLRWWPDQGAQSTPDAVFWLAGGQWRIPQAYAGGASDQPASLHFYARGKDFAPPPGPLVRSGPQPWSQIAQAVEVNLCAPEKIHPWYAANDARQQVRTLDVDGHGLARQEVVSGANQVPRIQYVQAGASGTAPLTWIACDGPDASCRHAFARDGMRVEFMHAAKDLPDWKTMQDALWQRVQSFALKWPDTAVRRCTPGPTP